MPGPLILTYGCITAWSVSLNPNGSTYASSSASGNITIHSADPADFGRKLSSIPSGRVKFGMSCRHVRNSISRTHEILSHFLHIHIQSPDGRRVALGLETGQIFVFDLESNTLWTTFTSHAMPMRSISWSADSSVSVIFDSLV